MEYLYPTTQNTTSPQTFTGCHTSVIDYNKNQKNSIMKALFTTYGMSVAMLQAGLSKNPTQLTTSINHMGRAFLRMALLLTLLLALAGATWGQTNASATWALTANNQPTVVGNVTAGNMAGGSGIATINYGTTNGASSNGWGSQTRDLSDYYEYTISPTNGNELTVTSVSFSHLRGGNKNGTVAVYYSHDDFITSTQIESNLTVSGNLTPVSLTSLAILVKTGQTLSIRIYAWDLRNDQSSYSNKNVVISGTTCVMPTITPGSNPAVCSGTTSAGLSYSATTGSPTQYKIEWDAAAISTGFSNVAFTTLPISPISIIVPSGASADTYNGELTVTNGNCESVGYAFTITVNPLPQGSLAGSTICAGGIGQLTFTATEGTGPFTLVINDETYNGIESGTAFDARPNPTESSIYELTSITDDNDCARTSGITFASATITVNPTSVGGTIDGGEVTVCTGTNSTLLTLSGHTGDVVKWQSSTDGNSWTDITNTSTTYTANNLTETTQFRAVVQSGVCSEVASAATTVTVDPATVAGTVSGGTTVCEGSTSGLLTLEGYTGTIQRWESSVSPFEVWTSITNTTATYTSGALTATTQFRAVVKSGVCAELASAATTVTVDPATVAGAVTGGTTICSGSTSAELTLAGHTGSIVRWESSESPFSSWTTITNTATTYTSGALTATTQFRAVVKSGVCNELASTATTVTVDPATVAGAVTGGTTICSGSTSAELTLAGYTGSIVRWESSESPFSSWTTITNTAATYTSGALTATTQFKAVVKSGVCNELASTATTVTVDPATVAGAVTGGTTICEGSTSAELTLSGYTGSIVRWESSESPFSSWTTITNTAATYTSGALTATTQFRAVVKSGVCAELASAATTVTVDPATVAGTVTGGTTVCEGSTSGLLTLAGHTGSIVRWESSEDGSVWTPIVHTAETYTSGALIATTQFRAVVKSGVCAELASAASTVTVDPATVAGTVTGGTTVCAGSTSGLLTLAGHTGSIVRWESSEDGTNWTSIANTEATYTSGALIATTQFRAVVKSGVCAEIASAATTVTVDPATVAGTVTGGATVCEGSTSAELTLSGHTGSIVRWESSVAPFDNWTSIANTEATYTSGALTATTQFRAVVKSGVCAELASAATTVTVDPATVAGTVTGGTTVCEGSTSGLLTLAGHTGSIVRWESSVNGIDWTEITNSGTTYTSGALIATTQFRAVVKSGVCDELASAATTVTVDPATVAGSVTGGATVCEGSTSAELTLSGHTGSIVRWESSVAPFNEWTSITNTEATYTSGALTATTQFRAVVKSGVCVELASAATTVNVKPFPTINAGSNQVVCANVNNITMTGFSFTGATGAVWSGGSGLWDETGDIYAPSAEDKAAGTIILTYTTTGAEPCQNVSDNITITFKPLPTINAGSDQVVCADVNYVSMTGYSFTGATGAVWSGGSGLWDETGDIYSPSAEDKASGNILLSYTTTGAEPCDNVSDNITVTFNPVTVAGSVGISTSVCSGTNSTELTLTGHIGQVIKWQYLAAGETVWADIENNTTEYTVENLIVSTQFRAVVKSGECNTEYSAAATITVNNIPDVATISQPGSVCDGGSINPGSPDVTDNGATVSLQGWQLETAVGSGEFAGISMPYQLAFADNGKQLRYFATNSCGTAYSNQVSLMVHPEPAAPASGGDKEICAGANIPALTVTVGEGETADWYTEMSGGSKVAEATLSYTPTEAGTWYAEARNTSSQCISASRTAVSLTVNELPVVSLTSQTDILCYGASTGAIDITASGGEGPYTYAWTGTEVNLTAEDQTGLAAGDYSVIITDNKGCSSASLPVTLSQPATAISASASAGTILCNGGTTTLTVTAAGGTGSLEYSLDGGAYQAGNTFTVSASATPYVVTVKDANGCVKVADGVTVSEPDEFTAGAIAITGEAIVYLGDPGVIGSLTPASGGDGNITYEWRSNGVAIANSDAATYNPPSGLTVTTTYTRWAKDATCNTTFTQSSGEWIVTISEAAALAWLQDNTVLSSVTGTIADLKAQFPASIPPVISDADYKINSRITLGQALPAGATITIQRGANIEVSNKTLTGTGPFWYTDLVGIPMSSAADFNSPLYDGAVENYIITINAPANHLAFTTTVFIESVISNNVFASNFTVLDDITLNATIPANEAAALAWLQDNTVLSSVTGTIADLKAQFPASIPPVISDADYKINSRITLGQALPAGATITIQRGANIEVSNKTLTGTGPFWYTDLVGIPMSSAADFNSPLYDGAVENYIITINAPANHLAFTTTVFIESVISNNVFASNFTVLDDITLNATIPANEAAALAWLQDNTVLSSTTGTIADLKAQFPASIPPVISDADYKINSRITLGQALPAGATITIQRGANIEVSNKTLTGTGPFWYTDLVGIPMSSAADFNSPLYDGAVENYIITINAPANHLAFTTTVFIESVISNNVFASNFTVLDDITLNATIPANEAAALAWLQDNTVLSSVTGTIADLKAQFPASIPPVISDADYKINSRMTISGDAIPSGSTVDISVTVNGVGPIAYVTGAPIPASPFWITDLNGATPSDFDGNYGGTIEIYNITINSGGGNPLELNGEVFVESIISKDGFSTNTVLDDITLGWSLPDAVAPVLVEVTPTEGAQCMFGGNFIWKVQASDANLYSLEVDHSMENILPEFTVYASASNVYGSPEAASLFAAAGVTITYNETTQEWTFDFGASITQQFINNGGITFYIVLKDIAGNQWGTMFGTTPANTFAYTFDNVAPELVAVTPATGAQCQAGGNFVWKVQASDANLYSLEVDHSMEGTLPEFTVYASTANVYGSTEAADLFAAAGVSITYNETTQEWTLDFGASITQQFINNGGITFYTVLRDCNRNALGSMSPPSPANTFAYTFDNEAPVITLNGNAEVSLCQNAEYTEPGATITDNCEDLSSALVINSNVNTAVPGNYEVTYNVTDAAGNSAAQVTRTVTVNPKPTLATVTAAAVCEGNTTNVVLTGLIPNVAGVAYYTIGNDPFVHTHAGTADEDGTFSFTTPVLSLAENGLVIAVKKLTVDGTLCETTFTDKSVALVVNPNPTISGLTVSPAATVCIGSPISFTATGLLNGETTFTYSVAVSGGPAAPPVPPVTYTVTGNAVTFPAGVPDVGVYNITIVSATVNGCTTTFTENNTATFTVVPDPTISISGGTAICAGGSATLTAIAANGTGTPTIQWQSYNGSAWTDITGENGVTLTVSPAATTDYRATYSCDGEGCTTATSNIQTITVYPAISFTAPQGTTVDACSFTTQSAVNAAFDAWLAAQTNALNVQGGFTAGSATVQVSNNWTTGNYPTLLTGGSVTVEWTISDACETLNPQATFELTAGSLLVYNEDQDTYYCSIQAAINAAADGNTIIAGAGTFTENLSFAGKNGIVLKGAQAGVSAGVGASRNASSTTGESIIIGTITTGSGTSAWPDGLTLDGFRFENTSFVQSIRMKGDVVITNSIIHFTSTYYMISVGGNVGMEHNLSLTNSNINGQRGFSADNARITSLLVDNNVFNTTAACLISGSALDGIVAVTNNEFNSPRGVNILTNNNIITGNTFNVTTGATSRAIDLYEVTGNMITGNTFSANALSLNFIAGGRNAVVLNNTIQNNAILGGIYNPLAKTVNATCNWFGTDAYSNIFSKVTGPVVYVPYLLTNDLVTGTCGGGPAIPASLALTYNEGSENILVSFNVTANELELQPVPGLALNDPDYLAKVTSRYTALAAAIASGVPANIQAAALAVGDDVFTEYYYYTDEVNQTGKTYLKTLNNNDLVKNKYWEKYLVRSSNTSDRYPDWAANKTLLDQDNFRTNTNPGTFAVAPGWLEDVLGKNLYVTVTFINNGSVRTITESVAIGQGPVNVYSADPSVPANWVSSHYTIQAAIDAASENGFVVVGDGTYYEKITINKAGLTVKNGSSPVIDGGGSGTVVTITANNVTFEGFTVKNSGATANDAGIFLNNVSGVNITGNVITDNANGVALVGGSGNTVYDNEVNDNSLYGIVLAGSSTNTIELNEITGNGFDALALDNLAAATGNSAHKVVGANGNFIKTNTLSSNRDGIFIGENCTSNQITHGNIISNITSIGIHVWRNGTQTISDNTITSSLVGIKLRGTQNSTVTGNTITGNGVGIEVEAYYVGGNWYPASNNAISGNIIAGNTLGMRADHPEQTTPINATANWWGNATGPNRASDNACGTGNAVTANVDICNWYTDEAMTNLNGCVIALFNVTGGGEYCANTSGINVGLSGSESGVNYQLYRGATAQGTPVAGTGSTIDFGLQTLEGTYTVKATNTFTGCSDVAMNGSVEVTILEAVEVAISVDGTNPLPALPGTGSTTICANEPFAMTLLAINQGAGPMTFVYNVRENNISGNILLANQSTGAISAGGTIYSAATGELVAGTYFIETLSITDFNGCKVQPVVMAAGYYNHTLVVKQAVEVAISVDGINPLPALPGTGSTTICANEPFAMTLLAINQGTGPMTFVYNVYAGTDNTGTKLVDEASTGAISAGGTIYSAAAGALVAGTYFIETLSITDANGCRVQPSVMAAGYYNHTIVVRQAVEVAISVDGINPLPALPGTGSTTICANEPFAMTLLAINQGAGPMTFVYNVRENNISGNILLANQSTGAISAGGTIYSAAAGELVAGTYFIETLSITDFNGCKVQPVVMAAGYYNHTLVVKGCRWPALVSTEWKPATMPASKLLLQHTCGSNPVCKIRRYGTLQRNIHG
jgi:parallel beta-helix repeat protein